MIPYHLLSKRVTVKAPVQSMVTGTKQPQATWSSVGTNVPASILPLSSREQATLLGVLPRATHSLYMNLDCALKPGYQVVWDSITYLVSKAETYGDHIEAVLEKCL